MVQGRWGKQLALDILNKYGSTDDYFDCDIPSIAARLQNPEPVLLKRLFGNAKLIVIDKLRGLRISCPVLRIEGNYSSKEILDMAVSRIDELNKL